MRLNSPIAIILAFSGWWMVPVQAQTLGVDRFANPALDLGRMTAASSGDTVFRIASSTGAITRVSGSGSRLSSSSGNILVTLTCSDKGKVSYCDSTSILVEIRAAGSTGRARNLTEFNVTRGTAVMSNTRSADILSFTVEPIPSGGSRTFYLGADFTVAGNESQLPTGTASAAFNVTVSKLDGTALVSQTGNISAEVLRPLSVQALSSLEFGTLIRPTSGTGTVTIDPVKDSRILQGVQALPTPAPKSAEFSVIGEGGETFSVSVPSSFQMKNGGEIILVTTSHTAGTSPRLSSAGTSAFKVGGSFPISQATRLGIYSGTFTVSVQYN